MHREQVEHEQGPCTEREELLRFLESRGVEPEAMREASAADRLPMLATERALAGEPRYTARELAERAAVPLDVLLDARRAIGVATDARERVFGEQDLEWARTLARLLDAGLPAQSLLETLRVLGRGLAYGARSARETLAEGLLGEELSDHDLALRTVAAAEQLLPLAGTLLQQILRMHLLEQVTREQITMAELRGARRLPGTHHVAVCFADLVGFTEIGERSAPEQVEDVATRLERMTAARVEPPVQLVKTIGDAVMLVAPETPPLVDLALELVADAGEQGPSFPSLRAGIACGPATTHSGDWYGRPVNLASRITDSAAAGTVVCTEDVRQAVGDGELRWHRLGERRLKGIDASVQLLEVHRARGGAP